MQMSEDQTARLNNVYNNREKAIAENNASYNDLINQAGTLRDQQNAYASQYEQTQNEIADKQLAYNTDIINQQKEQANKAYQKESNKALNEYQAYTNPYGSQSEIIGQSGLRNSGVSETMQLGAYTAYQNRVAQANTTLQNALTTYDNNINEARLNNDVTKAQNALNKLKLQLESAESYYTNVSSLTQSKLNMTQQLTSHYDSLYNTVYSQILQEQQQQEAIRQYNEQMAYQRERDAIADQQWQKQYQLSLSKSSSGGGSTSTSVAKTSSGSDTGLSFVSLNNNSSTKSKSDYYFKTSDGSAGYQPRYINNSKISKTGLTLKDIGTINGVSGSKNIWQGVDSKGKTAYYVWDEDHYLDVTPYMK